ncbi:mannose-1-phosphate guanylyltransferase/mannose-6-phosphate isomerase [Lonepinella sp. MS14437]|uniref:mannose-1-phosphate guanylyltransferase/mannose-6-phosphate isomerase n=1 Tax=Lonepinella sp. MS14437 TaxID=3003620 RepID=UPI0036D8EB91
MFIPIVMAGGSGSRLWPLSRSMFPKQFLALDNKHKLTMLQATLDRVVDISAQNPIVITNENHRFIVAEQLREYGVDARIILEPVGRNTAPAIALAAFEAIKNGQDPVLLILAADHVILDKQAFQNSIRLALKQAEKGNLTTFGIVPTAPETGYGYIERGEDLSDGSYKVKQFIEKPKLEVAQQYLASGNYYWNSGCFMFKASRYLEELRKFSPEIYSACEKAQYKDIQNSDFIRVNKEEFEKCPDDSIDYAVMEKASDVTVIPLDAGWNDVGSWSALWEVSDKDSNGNVYFGDVITNNTENSYIYAPNKLVAAVGLKDIIVVETKDAVLVADKAKVQEVKQIVEQLKNDNRSEYREHREVYRSWGRSDAIDRGSRYKVNKITIKPGKSEEKQIHYNRAEHWIVVRGTAKVSRNEEVTLLKENQSIYISIGVSHKIENVGKIPLELIEVQSGSYLGDDDFIILD